MKILGAALVIVGLAWALIAFNMSTTVEAGGERIGSGAFTVDIPRVTVNNLGLMERRRNHLMMAAVTILAGIILFGFGTVSIPQQITTDEKQRTCPFCAEVIKAEAKVCRFCQRELPSLEAEIASSQAANQLIAERDAANAEMIRQTDALKPKGRCPNCTSLIALDSLKCQKCNAQFGPSSGWKVKPLK